MDKHYFEILRNCGFMWEPGYFAVIIIFALMYRWLTKGVSLDYHYWIYFIAMITTFSTSGYIALMILTSAAFVKKVNIFGLLSLSLLIIISIIYVYELPFISDKIENYQESVIDNEFNYSSEYKSIKLNRFQIALYDVKRVYSYPFGLGLNERATTGNYDVTGTNGISGLLRMWGVPIFILFMINLFKYFKIINNNAVNNYGQIALFIAFLIMFFSQNLHSSILLYLLILTPFFYKNKIVENDR